MLNKKRTVIVTGSMGRATVRTDVVLASELFEVLDKEFNIDPVGQGAKVQISTHDLTVESENSKLPEEDFVMVISPVALKQGQDEYTTTFDVDEVTDLEYKSAKGEVKSLRKQAISYDDDQMLDALDTPDSYTRQTTEQLRETIRRVYTLLSDRRVTPVQGDATGLVPGLEERLWAIEKQLGIHNEYNTGRWLEWADKEAERVRGGWPADAMERFGHDLDV